MKKETKQNKTKQNKNSSILFVNTCFLYSQKKKEEN